MIQAVTDNPTRTVADVRYKLSRNGGNLGATNSVAFMFDRKGQLYLDAAKLDEDAALEAALEAGAEDLKRDEDQFVVTTAAGELHAVREALQARGVHVREAELAWVPQSTVRVEGDAAQQLVKLLDALDELDDVQKVDANFDMDVSELAEA